MLQVQKFRTLPQWLPKREDEDPRRLYNHKETPRYVRSNMFPLWWSRALCQRMPQGDGDLWQIVECNEKYSSRSVVIFLLVRCRIEACNGMQEIVIIWESIKLASLVLIWILWVVTLWRIFFTIFEDMRNMVYGRLCILKVVVPCEETWPLEKGNDIPWSGFRTK